MEPQKVGAGLFLVCDGQVLLLLRAGNHNANTWGLPGGNREGSDQDLLETAIREATEEIGALPPFRVVTEFLTQRGKHKQKHYTVFIAEMKEKDSFAPQLNHEHTDWRWFDVGSLLQREDLHPVVQILMQTHQQGVMEALKEAK